MEENRHPARMRVHTLLSELVAAQFQVTGCRNPVYPDLIVGIYIIAYERRMDLSPDEKPSHGWCLQQWKRILHAGDPSVEQRLLGKSAYTVLLQEEMESGVDQCRKPVSGNNSPGNSRFGKILCRSQSIHQTADRKGILDVHLRFQVPGPFGNRLQPPAKPSKGL